VHDREGHPVVVDWRAPVSRAFYRASPADPMGLALRRRFGFSGGDLTAHEDERFTGLAAAQPDGAPVSRILIEEIERPRSGPMRDIVATIAPDQDDIVRAEADQTLCVQGAPGTGKTAVGLHRVAYLLYAFAGRMTRGGVLVIGPNRAFLWRSRLGRTATVPGPAVCSSSPANTCSSPSSTRRVSSSWSWTCTGLPFPCRLRFSAREEAPPVCSPLHCHHRFHAPAGVPPPAGLPDRTRSGTTQPGKSGQRNLLRHQVACTARGRWLSVCHLTRSGIFG
jgi:hypothetical protein